ncbi:molybdopterin-dependent oxidoreductase [Desulfohalobiaceae bacterium Ax17]|uniref:molybdopterin-containing oxidoreductase family protein n=1 Tax=Desulfovulcanus ferrireducens TaxID=2831190 RepID=UPI00207BB56C|nr:molybdopterin-dependent oxidoreductase [Desulfovulcanus ferrireducens]MBT8762539.1 molybdopterin-dependent oxidoreductase [Desulfovulcanus ferrireducens]
MSKFIDRRKFISSLLKTAACIGVYPVLSYSATERLSPKIKGVKKYVTGCMWCQNACSMIIYIKDGKVVHLTGNPDDPVTKGKICIKPFGSLELINSPHRLTYPLKRIGKRGFDASFIRVSWEEALDEIAQKLKHIREKYGGEALGIWASGRSAFDGRILNKAFAKLYGTPNYEKTGPFCNYAAKPAGISVLGTRHTPWVYSDDDFYGADLYIFIGSNMAATRPVIFSRMKDNQSKGKCKFIVIDPRRSETAKRADLWLPIKPGRDLALALTLIHYIITHDLVDEEFVKNHTVGFQQLKKEVLDGNYTLSWGSRITGIPEDKIAYLADTYVRTKKAIIIGNSGLSHHTNAVQTHRAFYFLAAITGHFGEKSTGYCCLNNGGISIGSLPLPKDRIVKTKMELSKNPVGWLESIENPLYPYKLRALIATGSPLTQWPNQSRVRRLIEKLELSVYNGLTKNINAYYFDYILPAAFWIEVGGLAPVSDDSRFVWVPKLLDPPGLAKPDKWWWIELGKRMGWGDIFTDDLKNPVILQNTVGGPKGYKVENFIAKKNNSLRAPIKLIKGQVQERGTLFLDKRFPTKSGKIELWTEEIERKFAAYGLSAIPRYYVDPDIASQNESTIYYDKSQLILSPFQKNKCYTYKVSLTSKKENHDFPFYLITGRPSKAIMGHTSHWIKILNDISPDQFCLIHQKKANFLGINDGDVIIVYSRYGETMAKAILTPYIQKDTVFIPYSYGEKSPFTSWKSVNFLTDLEARCPISGQIAFKGIRVGIKKS